MKKQTQNKLLAEISAVSSKKLIKQIKNMRITYAKGKNANESASILIQALERELKTAYRAIKECDKNKKLYWKIIEKYVIGGKEFIAEIKKSVKG